MDQPEGHEMRGQGAETEAILYGEHRRYSGGHGKMIHLDTEQMERLRGSLPYALNRDPDALSAAVDRLSSALGIETYMRWDANDRLRQTPVGNTFICLSIGEELLEVPFDHQLVAPLRDGLGSFPSTIHADELVALQHPLDDFIVQGRNIFLP